MTWLSRFELLGTSFGGCWRNSRTGPLQGGAYRISYGESLVTVNAIPAMVPAMIGLFVAVVGALRSGFRSRRGLVAENLAVRQQLAVLRRRQRRPQLRRLDRMFWILLSRLWSRWTDALAIVRPATVVAWHRRGFARFWNKKSRPVGRPPLQGEFVELIRRMARENPTCCSRAAVSGAERSRREDTLSPASGRAWPIRCRQVAVTLHQTAEPDGIRRNESGHAFLNASRAIRVKIASRLGFVKMPWPDSIPGASTSVFEDSQRHASVICNSCTAARSTSIGVGLRTGVVDSRRLHQNC